VGYWVGVVWKMPSLRQMVAPVACDGANGTSWATQFKAVNGADGTAMMQAVLAGNASRLDPDAIDPTPPCLSIVRDNINISLAMAATLAPGDDGTPTAPATAPVAQNPEVGPSCGPAMPMRRTDGCTAQYSVTAGYSFKAGKEYLLRIAIATTRGPEITPASSSAMAKALQLASGWTKPLAIESENAGVWVRPQRLFLHRFVLKSDHFAKTGSGQT
jgi:hypothetical protein